MPFCNRSLRSAGCGLEAALLLAMGAGADASAEGFTSRRPLMLAVDSYLYVGGEYVEVDGDTTMVGQSYVRVMIPRRNTQPYPVVMIHGGGQNGSSYTGTPDGRPGWAHAFLEAGYAVYVVDFPGNGKSPWVIDFYGTPTRMTPGVTERRFTATETFPLSLEGVCTGWPEAALHTQWPGTGLQGDPIFDRFFASQSPQPSGYAALVRDAVVALLDEIGPSIVMIHSRSGQPGWAILDARPELVKGFLAVEPNGPPFFNAPCPWAFFPGEPAERPWGLSDLPLTYDPPAADPSEIAIVQEAVPQGPDLVRCWMQDETVAGHPRQLVNIQGIPILVLQGEASYHAGYEHCTVQYLEQAGVDVDFIKLGDIGLHGHGHMMMLELGNLDIAEVMIDWLRDNVHRGR